MTEKAFIDDVLRGIMENRNSIIEDPIIDRFRFPTETFDASPPSSILDEVAHLLARREKYEEAAHLLADEESVALYRELLIFRALGPCRYALPLSTPDYINLYREETQYKIADSTRASYSWPMSVFRIDFHGCQIEMEVWDGSPTVLLSLMQYYFNRGAVCIQPGRGDVVLDVGACQGETALGFAAAVGMTGRVFAFEPMPVFQAEVRSNLQRNPQLASRIELVERAVTSRSDELVRMDDWGPGSQVSAQGAIETTTVSIDDFFHANGLERIDFIKMDIEGAERMALEGGAHVIARLQPKLAIAAYHGIDDLWQLPLLIKRLNPRYKLYLDHYTNHREETVIYAI